LPWNSRQCIQRKTQLAARVDTTAECRDHYVCTVVSALHRCIGWLLGHQPWSRASDGVSAQETASCGLRRAQESPPAVPEVPALTSPRRYFFAASAGAFASTSPRSASSCRVRTTIECASILKWRLAAARVSEKPKPSAPRVAKSWARKGRMRSGWVESKSLVATIGPTCPPRRCLTYGVRGSRSEEH